VITAAMGGSAPSAAWQVVDLSSQTTWLPLALRSTGTLRGRVVVEDGRAATAGTYIAAALMDNLIDVDALLLDTAEVDSDGRFELTGLYGARTVRMIHPPPGCVLKEVRRADRRLDSPHVVLAAAETIDIEVVLVCA
jgi:hypothetical protein